MAGLVESGSFGYSLVKEARQIIRYPEVSATPIGGSRRALWQDDLARWPGPLE